MAAGGSLDGLEVLDAGDRGAAPTARPSAAGASSGG
jgi:hypothetical protein